MDRRSNYQKSRDKTDLRLNPDLHAGVVHYTIGIGLLFCMIWLTEWYLTPTITGQILEDPFAVQLDSISDPVEKALVQLERQVLTADRKLSILKSEFKDLEDLKELRQKVQDVMTGGASQEGGAAAVKTIEDKAPQRQQAEAAYVAAVAAVKPMNLPERKPVDYSQYSFSRPLHDDGESTSQCRQIARSSLMVDDLYDKNNFKDPDGGVWKQGFDIKVDASKWSVTEQLEVWVVPHSHNDPGWIKTVVEYFNKQTRNILTTMIDMLVEDPARTFIWAEISYFCMWWDQVDDSMKSKVKKVIASGQFEIVGGGWVMPDEANTHYFAIIDQLMEGHQFLEKELGVKPKIGWAIDPFGHSPTMAYIMKRSGYEGMLIQRVHYEMKRMLAEKQSLEFLWRQDWDSKNTTDMFTHLMPFYSYDIPHTCGPDPSICCQFDFARMKGVASYRCPWKKAPQQITEANVKGRSEMLLDQYRKKSQLYRTNSVLIPLGDDFRWDTTKEARAQYDNYMRMFNFINSHPEYNAKLRFGTLSDYYHSVFAHAKKKNPSAAASQSAEPSGFPTLSGDFFTYADRKDNYWAGYYTSRPFYKHFDRELEAGIRSSEIMYTTSTQHKQQEFAQLRANRRELGIFQHHDGMTGTAKDHVVVDYGNRMLGAIAGSQTINIASIKPLIQSEQKVSPVPESTRKDHNALPQRTVIQISDEVQHVVIHNSLAQPRTQYTSVICNTIAMKVTDSSGTEIEAQAVPVWGTTNVEVWFEAQVPALGFAVYSVFSAPAGEKVELSAIDFRNTASDTGVDKAFPTNDKHVGDICTQSTTQSVCFNGETGMLQGIGKVGAGASEMTKVELQFIQYGSKKGKGQDASGAYLFMPDGPAQPHSSLKDREIRVAEGKYLLEVHVTDLSAAKITHIARVFKRGAAVAGSSISISNYVDLQGIGINIEIGMRLITGVKHGKKFHTDLNGFQMRQRETLDKLPMQGNFFPLPSMAILEDDHARLTVNTRSALGCSALQDGWFEVMLDRRLQQDDNRGLFQKVLDNVRTESNFELLFERKTSSNTQRDGTPSLLGVVVNDFLNYPLYRYISKTSDHMIMKHAPVMSPIPCDVHVVNMRSLDEQSDEIALLLHRRALSCVNFEPSLPCANEMDQDGMDLIKTFSSLNIKTVEARSLTMMHAVASDMAKSPIVQLNPREIYAWKMHRS